MTERVAPPSSSSSTGGRRRPPRPWYLAVVATALAVTLAAILLTDRGGRPSSTEQPSTGANSQPGINAATSLLLSLTVFPPSSHPLAPNFSLTDQHGQPVSMKRFRGKVVVFSANDDRCQDLCTLLANDIVQANRDLGRAAGDVVWLGVNANPFYPQVSSVRTWTDQHGLGDQPNWHFGTANPATLRQVWKRYGVVVETDSKTRTVDHSTELFFIDPAGRERAVAEFGAASANTSLFAHGIAQMADDLLPAQERVHTTGPETPSPTANNAAVGASLPDFSLRYLPPATGSFRPSSLRGKYAVINFWSSTCTLCRVELPHLEKAYRYAGHQVDFVGVDVSDTTAAARAMATRAGLTYPLVSDPDGTASGDARIDGLPYTLIVDPQGHIVIRHAGNITTEQLDYLLQSYDPSLPSN